MQPKKLQLPVYCQFIPPSNILLTVHFRISSYFSWVHHSPLEFSNCFFPQLGEVPKCPIVKLILHPIHRDQDHDKRDAPQDLPFIQTLSLSSLLLRLEKFCNCSWHRPHLPKQPQNFKPHLPNHATMNDCHWFMSNWCRQVSMASLLQLGFNYSAINFPYYTISIIHQYPAKIENVIFLRVTKTTRGKKEKKLIIHNHVTIAAIRSMPQP